VAAIRRRGRFGVSLGLDRIERLLAALDHPERLLRGALVGGTNGKGSVVALAGAVLREAGLKVGTMPKPHLVMYRERITIDGQMLEPGEFGAVVGAVIAEADRLAGDAGPPTEFEVLTAAGFVALARAGVDVALVEVGLGGRLDATNAADLGVAAITTVAHDHERHLGRTLAAIGTEKAAIIKAGDLAVTGARGRGLGPITSRCAEMDVPLRRAGPSQAWEARVLDSDWEGPVVDLRTPSGWVRDLRIALLGSHQGANAAVAIALLDALREDAERRGRPVELSEDALRSGMAAAHWPGRLELFRAAVGGRDLLLDGAHNPSGARALAQALTELGVRRFPLVFGAMRGKRVAAVLRALAPLEPRPVFTAVDDPHAHRPAALLRTWRRIAPGARGAQTGSTADTPAAAVERAADLSPSAGPVVVAGSLYLVGAVRATLTGETPDA
jgi:dihydrofolate synthase / folylpolyglutamate synthase